MAVSFLVNREVSDLCLGKPPLKWVHVGSTISEALLALKRSGDSHLSVWRCSGPTNHSSCECVGKICMVDLICFLAKEENLVNPLKAFEAPVYEILLKGPPFIVRHLEPNSSLLEAIECILDGAQNLVIPIEKFASRDARRKFLKKQSSVNFSLHNGHEYCWLTQEDVVRYLLNSIGVFSPTPTFTIESLKIIDQDIMSIQYDDTASSALSFISRAHANQTSVAVIDESNRLIGEISPFNLATCDETVAAAITSLSAGDLMAYIDCGGPPEDLVQLVKTRLEEKNLDAMLDLVEEYSMSLLSSSSSCCSTDDESVSSKSGASSTRYFPARRSEPIICYPWSSLAAVMIQMLAHRATCIWVVEKDHTLVGLVSLEGVLKVFRSISDTQNKLEGKISSGL